MPDYRLTDTDAVIRLVDMAYIPNDASLAARAAYTKWLAAGGKPDPAPPPPAVTVRSQDMIALLTPTDAAKIQTAVAGNINLWLLWSALQAQDDPMVITSARFQQGWGALTSVLGKARMNEIAVALGASALVAT